MATKTEKYIREVMIVLDEKGRVLGAHVARATRFTEDGGKVREFQDGPEELPPSEIATILPNAAIIAESAKATEELRQLKEAHSDLVREHGKINARLSAAETQLTKEKNTKVL